MKLSQSNSGSNLNQRSVTMPVQKQFSNPESKAFSSPQMQGQNLFVPSKGYNSAQKLNF